MPPGNIQLSWIETITNGNSGDVFIDSRGNITLPPGGVIATSSRVGNPGDVTLISNGSFSLINGAQIRSDIIGNQQANAGDVTIKVLGDVTISGYGRNVTGGFSNSGIATQVEQGGRGNSGNIYIQARSLLSNDGGGLSVSLLGQGSAGQIAVRVDDFVTLTNGGFISSNVLGGGAGNAGTIEINAPGSVTLSGFSSTDGLRSGLRARVNPGGVGQAGSINVNTGNFRVNNGANVDTSTFSLDGGRITINVNSLEVAGGGQVLTASSGTGKAGDLLINATDFVNVNTQGLVTTGSTGTGSGGSLSINTRQFNISDSGSVVGTNAFGSGKAGDLLISATNSVNVSNQGLLTTGSLRSGNGGKLSISTRRLDVINGGVDGGISTAALGTGTSGALSVVATDSINVVSGSNIITSAKQGVAGRLEIETGKLSIRDNSFVVTSTFGASSGDLSVRAADSIEVVNGSGLSTSTNGSGKAGNVIIETQNLLVDTNSKLSADTFSSGNGGDMSITTGTLSVQNGGEVSTGVFENSSGNGGKLSVTASDSIELNGGTVTVNASESIELIGNSGSGTNQPAAISAFSDNLSIGNAPSGNINLTTGELIIRDGAEVTTATLGRGEGGDIRVQANSLSLSNNGNITSRSTGQVNAGNAGNIFVNLNDKLQSNGGIISTTSERAGGGDINITADDIRLRKSSLISSSVFDSTGGGGNITISSTVFLAIEDSDILANAEAGPGGNITINSSAFLADLFSSGVAVPVGRNPGDLGRFRGNGRNDISVSAAFRGNDRVDISADSRTGTSGAVVIRGSFSERRVNPLPSWVDAEELIDRRCTPSSSTKTSSFTITGRGGLPPSPNDPLMYQDELVDWVTLEDREETPSSEASNTDSTPSNPQQLVEAQGWVIGADGQIMLTASASTVTPGNSGLGYPSCEENKATTD